MNDEATSATAVAGPVVERAVMPPAKACDCLEQVNVKLMERGYSLAVRDIVRFGPDKQPCEEIGTAPLLKVEKISRKAKGSAPSVCGPFCMFCGQRRWPAA